MPASNRRPLWDDKDAPSTSDTTIKHTLQKGQPLVSLAETPAAAAATLPTQPSFKQPCTLKGATSALYAGMLGYFFGIAPAAIKFKGRQWGMIHTQGLGSARQLAVMSGMYTAVHCICQRIRMVEDGWNRGIAGCSTGLVLGWSNGPWSALQSCAGIGLISALIDLGGSTEAAEASVLQPLQYPYTHSHQHSQQLQQPHMQQHYEIGSRQHKHQQQGDAMQMLPGLPQPAQLLALLMGASPDTFHSTAPSNPSSAVDDSKPGSLAAAAEQQHRQHKPQGLVGPVQGMRIGALQQQQQAWQQQPLAAAAALLQPAAHVMQQLLAAPPLMYLGACCHSNAAAAAAGLETAGLGVNGCAVKAPLSSIGANMRS